jgi:DNA-binding transcriptional MerR regulator
MTLSVSELAGEVGVTADTIRYYEREGLLPAPPRTASGYRRYDEATVGRVRFIKGAQRFGLRLREIREVLEVVDRGICPCGHTEALIRRRLAELDEEMARLAETRRELLRLTERFAEGPCPPDADGWLCDREFSRAGGGTSDGRS